MTKPFFLSILKKILVNLIFLHRPEIECYHDKNQYQNCSLVFDDGKSMFHSRGEKICHAEDALMLQSWLVSS